MPRPKKFRSFSLGKKYPGITGMDGLVAKLAALGSAVEDQPIYDVLFEAGREVRDEVRSGTPYDPKRKKGRHLRDAPFCSEGDPSKWPTGPNIITGVSPKVAPHRLLIEYGTSRMAARPFWRPGIKRARPAVAAIYEKGISKIIAAVTASKPAGAAAAVSFPWTGGGYDQ